ncbi:GtrA family protein [Herbaspirillum sp. RTI4]|uniref:GtrA family protein n=1 Tax=Herbaspirillum sp. RTI4 TaxID=3048640 RepID=UPI003A0FE447
MNKYVSTRFTKYLIVGGLNTLFGLLVFSLFALTPLPTWMVLIISNIVCITFNFFTTGSLVFENASAKKIPRFLICYGVIFIIYLELIGWLSPIVGGRIWAMAVVVLPMALFTYYLQSRFVFGTQVAAPSDQNLL